MLTLPIVEFFKHKIVSSIIVLACWSPADRIKLIRDFSQYGLRATFSCEANFLNDIDLNTLHGFLYYSDFQVNLTEKVNKKYFSIPYKWLIVASQLPDDLHKTRYDADIVFLSTEMDINTTTPTHDVKYFYDVYLHPRTGATLHPWAIWTEATGFQLAHETERIRRRQDLKGYHLTVATPVAHYRSETYDGTLADYLRDESMSQHDPAVRCGYLTVELLLDSINARKTLMVTEFWSTSLRNNSMYVKVSEGAADLSGAVIRVLWERIADLDYVLPSWPYSGGFTYLAERESTSNMYLEPFSAGVWWSCLVIVAALVLVQRLTSKSQEEKDGAWYTVVATWLQQVPQGGSGRWTFTVLSLSAMMVHAYYTSAIVSALMSTGRGGPATLRALGDSKYTIASDDFDYFHDYFFDVETTWKDLEYLKKKKMTSSFYKDMKIGVDLIEQGHTAYCTEYNLIYPLFKSFSDDQICKLQHVDIMPEVLIWTTATKNGQWTSILRPAGAWLMETGLVRRLVSRLKIPKPPCRASLLAERVTFGDVAPLLAVTGFGVVLSGVLLSLEILVFKWNEKGSNRRVLLRERGSLSATFY